MTPSLAGAAGRLYAAHHRPEPLILPNAWDVASALAVERAGALAVATTSSGVAAALGYPDGEAIPVAEMLAAVRRIAAAVSVPVTADLEAGYGLAAEDLVAGLLQAGAVGLNLEDTDRSARPPGLVDAGRQAERLAAVRGAATAAGVPVVINARIDVFLRGSGPHEGRVDEAIERALDYLAAGADCVYPIWLTDAAAIGRIVREVAAPVNVLLRPGAPAVAELRRIGVRRISVGGGLAHHAITATEAIARRLLAGDVAPFLELGEV
ncbi:MAG: isocitrate lyase/PEP mutase family protein [Candidatus Limnocylindria bacterium]